MTNASLDGFLKALEKQRILLVGGAGFIGHHLALKLREFGLEVMVLDNLMFNSLIENVYGTDRSEVQEELYRSFLLERFELMRAAEVEMRNGDARNSVDLMRVFSEFKPTKIVHLSAIASAVRARLDPGLCFDLQLVTLRNVLEICREERDTVNQVMFLSSSTVYGDFDTASVDESVRPNPRGIYANAKYMGERLIRTYNQQHELGISIVRPSALYGERCVSRRVSQMFIENALSGKPLRLEGGGSGRLDFTYIDDLIDGMVRTLALDCSNGASHTFNLTFGNSRSIADLAEEVRLVVPDVETEDAPKANDKPVRGTLSIERAKEVIGFKPSWPLEKGYAKYAAWYAEKWEVAAGLANTGGTKQ